MEFYRASAHPGALMGYCDHQVHILMGRLLRDYEVSPMQCRVLTFLHEAGESVNQKVLEQFLMVKPSTVNGVVDRLEEKGYLQRVASPLDARCRLLQLTEQGMRFYDDFTRIMQQINDIVESDFTEQELSQLRSLLLRLADKLTEEVNK